MEKTALSITTGDVSTFDFSSKLQILHNGKHLSYGIAVVLLLIAYKNYP